MMSDDASTECGAAKARCPICGKPRAAAYRPFCSRHCADVDLGRWLSESYTMPLPDDEAFGDLDEPDR